MLPLIEQAVNTLLESPNESDWDLAQLMLDSPYCQFVPRPDRPNDGDEMSSFIGDDHPGKIVLGGTGSAKSRTTAWLFAHMLYTNEPPEPNTPVWIISQTLDMTGVIWSQALANYIDKNDIASVRWRKAGLYPEIVLMKPDEHGNSWNIHFFSCEQGRAALQAANVWMAWVDEQAPSEIIEEIWGRLRRWHHANMFLLTCTPLTPDAWLQELWERRDEEAVKNLYKFYRLNTMFNEWLPQEWRDNFLASLSPDQRLTRQFGDFCNYKGAVFPEFTSDLIIDPFDTESFEQLIGIDPGFHHPGVLWLARRPTDDWFIIDEMQLHDVLPDDVAAGMKRRYDYRHKAIIDYEDPITARYLKKAGIHTSPCIGKDNLDSINLCKNFFWQKKIHVFKTCKDTIRQLRAYRWKQFKEDKEEKDEVIKVNDHLVDAMRYVLYTLTKRAVKPWEQIGTPPAKLVSKAGIPTIMRPNVGRLTDPFNRR